MISTLSVHMKPTAESPFEIRDEKDNEFPNLIMNK